MNGGQKDETGDLSNEYRRRKKKEKIVFVPRTMGKGNMQGKQEFKGIYIRLKLADAKFHGNVFYST